MELIAILVGTDTYNKIACMLANPRDIVYYSQTVLIFLYTNIYNTVQYCILYVYVYYTYIYTAMECITFDSMEGSCLFCIGHVETMYVFALDVLICTIVFDILHNFAYIFADVVHSQ